MRLHTFRHMILLVAIQSLAISAYADTVGIGTAAPFAVLGEAGVTNTGASVIYGSVAGSISTSTVSGLSSPPSAPAPGTVLPPGVLYSAGVASGVGFPFGDALTAYNDIAGEAPGTPLAAGFLTGATLTPGVYTVASSTTFDLSAGGVLTLDAQGHSNATWVIIMSTSLLTGSGSIVDVINGGTAGSPFTGSITWEAPTGAILGTTTSFLGTILSDAGDVVKTGATIGCGRVISLDASVTLDTNVIDTPLDCTVVTVGTTGSHGTGAPTAGTGTIAAPEPCTFVLLLSGLIPIIGLLMYRKVS